VLTIEALSTRFRVGVSMVGSRDCLEDHVDVAEEHRTSLLQVSVAVLVEDDLPAIGIRRPR
jgi:hypothetical protein